MFPLVFPVVSTPVLVLMLWNNLDKAQSTVHTSQIPTLQREYFYRVNADRLITQTDVSVLIQSPYILFCAGVVQSDGS